MHHPHMPHAHEQQDRTLGKATAPAAGDRQQRLHVTHTCTRLAAVRTARLRKWRAGAGVPIQTVCTAGTTLFNVYANALASYALGLFIKPHDDDGRRA